MTGYGWNGSRYYDLETGRFVSSVRVQAELETLIDASAVRMNILTQKLIDETITLADWQTGMMQQIKIANVSSAALANGGWAQMDQSDWGAVGQLVKNQYQHLRDFAKDIETGKQPLDGRALVRSDLYGDAANGTYEQTIRRNYILDGWEEEMRVLEDGANHCDGCIDQAGHWEPIGDLDAIGAEECATRCRCHFKYRRMTDGGWEESE